jgi:hypothetical protein
MSFTAASSGLLDREVVGGDRGFARALVQAEQRLGLAAGCAGAACFDPAAIFVARRVLQVGEAVEAEGLAEPHDRRARGVRAARQLLGRLERHLVEMVDDVLRHVLLGP